MGILVAIADDGRSDAVLEVAAQFAHRMDTSLTVAHITANESASETDRSLRDEIRSFFDERELQAEITLEHLNRDGLRSGTAIGKELVDIAEGVDIDHVVIGHRSKTSLAELRDGHTGFVVAQQASVPVTIVPETLER